MTEQSMHAYSQRYDDALILAAQAHRTQLRKGTDIPYIMHPFHVSAILIRYGFSEDLVVAGALHDVVEDCGVSLETIAERFGERVAQLVAAVSERKAENGMTLSWEDRKTSKLTELREAGADVAALKAADALHNSRSVIAALRESGSSIWGRFSRGPEPTLWYYREILSGVRLWLDTHPLADELEGAILELEMLTREGS
jgi:(p)ppGpp synthase/HD superfamily hydrolase